MKRREKSRVLLQQSRHRSAKWMLKGAVLALAVTGHPQFVHAAATVVQLQKVVSVQRIVYDNSSNPSTKSAKLKIVGADGASASWTFRIPFPDAANRVSAEVASCMQMATLAMSNSTKYLFTLSYTNTTFSNQNVVDVDTGAGSIICSVATK